LKDRGFPIHARSLCEATARNRLDIVQFLIKHHSADVYLGDQGKLGYTPLFIAAQQGNLAMMRCFVKEQGIDVV
jgi:ankyrin repeat protein